MTAQNAEYERGHGPGAADDMCALTVGSLFSGIGGIDLGLERAGMRVIWQAEVNEYASRVLAKHWPDVPNLGDVTKVDWDGVERPDVVAGGFPCQPVSQAGQRRAQADDRWLWPEYARTLRHLRPDHVIVENVPGLLVRGMGDVLGELASLGYDAEWEGIPAAAVGAPHLRWRIFIVAHSHSGCVCRDRSDSRDGRAVPTQGLQRVVRGGRGGQDPVPDADGCELWDEPVAQSWGRCPPVFGDHGEDEPVADAGGASSVEAGPALARTGTPTARGRGSSEPGGRRRGGPRLDPWWSAEPDVGRVAHGIPSRVDRLRGLGNAVVPQVAEFVGRRLLAHIDGQA